MAKSGTPAQVKAKFATWSDNWYGKCAAVVMTVCRHFGSVGDDNWAYGSARAAFEDATIESTDSTKAPAGAIHYWDYYGRNSRGELGSWGHVGVDLYGGGTRVLNATANADVAYGRGVGLGSVSDITGRVGRYRGWSRKYGRSFYATITAPTTGTPAGGDPKPVAAQQRIVRGGVTELNGRQAASTTAALAGEPLRKGKPGNFDAFIRGQRVTIQGVTSDLWFRGAISGRWFAAAGFTSRSTTGLKDLGTYKAPKPKPALRKRHARLSAPWFFHASERAARNAPRNHQGPTLPAGHYELVDQTRKSGPYQVWTDKTKRRKVWIGTGRTNPPVVRKW